jgi:hypothetical protein
MLKKAGILMIAAALGGGVAGLAACGEDRDGEVQFEDGGTETGGGTETAPTETAPTETSEDGGATAPEGTDTAEQ